MSHESSDRSAFDKNLRSLLDAISMLEREAGIVLERFGLESDAVSRVVDLLGSLSVEAVRPIASALGIADAASVESLMRDVQALLRSEAGTRRQQATVAARLEEIMTAVEALGATTATLAELQARLQERVDALAARGEAMPATGENRRELALLVEGLRSRIDDVEATLGTELGIAVAPGAASAAADAETAPGIRPRRQIPRPVKATAGSHKILEGLPAVEPKVRPA